MSRQANKGGGENTDMLKKIAVQHLRIGMHLHELCGSWIDHPFWRSKFVLAEQKDIQVIIDSGITEVWIDVSLGLDVPAIEVMEEAEAAPEAEMTEVAEVAINRRTNIPKQVSMSDEMQRAAKICDSAKDAVKFMFQEVRMGKAISVEVVDELTEEIASSVMRNPGALISLARLKTSDDYTYLHSVAVCALMVSLSRQLNLDQKHTREAGMAGLLHDLGKAFMPAEILNKPGKLTREEFDIIKAHPVEGHRALQEGGMVGEIPLEVCLHHHEKVDGSGYPDQLKDEQITLFSKMGAVCDVYDAITSNRPYKAGWDPAESISKMTEWSGGHFDQHVFQSFVKSVGIYPIGSLVRLTSTRLGVVMEQSEKSLLTPKVKIFFSTKSQVYITPEIVDLSRPTCVERIIGREDAAKWGIKNLDQLWAG